MDYNLLEKIGIMYSFAFPKDEGKRPKKKKQNIKNMKYSPK